jgi:glycerophosphoryl diester phosphodiesterase
VSGHRVAVSAHRGGAEAAPAATMAAYADALAAGCDYIEFDVRRTRDRELVVFHNRRVGSRRSHLAQLSRLELSGAAGHEVPGVRELMASINGRSKAHIDVKESGYEREIVEMAAEILGPENFVITSGDDVIAGVKRDFPEVRAAVSIGRGWREVLLPHPIRTRWRDVNPMRRVRACGADAVAVHYRLADQGVLATCAREGIGAMVWTVNGTAMIQSFMHDPRVEVLITDRPRFAMSQRA